MNLRQQIRERNDQIKSSYRRPAVQVLSAIPDGALLELKNMQVGETKTFFDLADDPGGRQNLHGACYRYGKSLGRKFSAMPVGADMVVTRKR